MRITTNEYGVTFLTSTEGIYVSVSETGDISYSCFFKSEQDMFEKMKAKNHEEIDFSDVLAFEMNDTD